MLSIAVDTETTFAEKARTFRAHFFSFAMLFTLSFRFNQLQSQKGKFGRFLIFSQRISLSVIISIGTRLSAGLRKISPQISLLIIQIIKKMG